jgi:hypothetical protein
MRTSGLVLQRLVNELDERSGSVWREAAVTADALVSNMHREAMNSFADASQILKQKVSQSRMKLIAAFQRPPVCA